MVRPSRTSPTAFPIRGRMIAVAEGVDVMEREEAGCWLGMAMHRPNPRRVLMALRCMLTEAGRE